MKEGKASLLAWAVRQGRAMDIIQAALGMGCVGMLEHELVRGERDKIDQQRQEKQRRAEKGHNAQLANGVCGGTCTHVGQTIDFETGTRALEKLSRTPSYIYMLIRALVYHMR